jgi:hypothetical protein
VEDRGPLPSREDAEVEARRGLVHVLVGALAARRDRPVQELERLVAAARAAVELARYVGVAQRERRRQVLGGERLLEQDRGPVPESGLEVAAAEVARDVVGEERELGARARVEPPRVEAPLREREPVEVGDDAALSGGPRRVGLHERRLDPPLRLVRQVLGVEVPRVVRVAAGRARGDGEASHVLDAARLAEVGVDTRYEVTRPHGARLERRAAQGTTKLDRYRDRHGISSALLDCGPQRTVDIGRRAPLRSAAPSLAASGRSQDGYHSGAGNRTPTTDGSLGVFAPVLPAV